MSLHALLQPVDLLHRAGKRTSDIHHIQHLERARLQCHKVLMVAAQRRGAHIVAAHIENDRIPIQYKGG